MVQTQIRVVTKWCLWPLLAVLLLAGCRSPDPSASTPSPDTAQADGPTEVAPQPLPLAAPLNRPGVEISGLTWHGDTLVVLPQYPTRAEGGSQVYGLTRSALAQAVADSSAPPLAPIVLPFKAEGLSGHMPAYQGCEAIAFVGDRVYVVTEGQAEGPGMEGVLMRGRVTGGTQSIHVREVQGRSLPRQAALPNMSYEALTTREDTVIALFEANGARVNERPRAYRYGTDLEALGPVPFPTLEYRLTDATSLDDQNRFWVINYFFPGDRDHLRPAPDSLARRHGTGPTHRRAETVERLVEYRYTPRGVRRTDTPPLWLELGENPRNWEGLVRFGDGFLVATDKFPDTILAYVPGPRDKR